MVFTKHSIERYYGRHLNKDPTLKVESKNDMAEYLNANIPKLLFICNNEIDGKSIYYSEEGIWVSQVDKDVMFIITFIGKDMLSQNQLRAIDAARCGKLKKAAYWYNLNYRERRCA